MDNLARYKHEAVVRKAVIGVCAWVACAAMTPFKDGAADKFAGGMGCMALFFSIMDLPYHERFKRLVSVFACMALTAAGIWVLASPIWIECEVSCAAVDVAVAFLFLTAVLEAVSFRLVNPNLAMHAEDDWTKKRAENVLVFVMRLDCALGVLYVVAAVVAVCTMSFGSSATFVLAAFLQVLQITSTWVQLRNVRKGLSIEATFVEVH
ncbi:hypothetical protein ACHHYP_14276 [Achlya hypogyna]|uniref:Transmembrane protein n=1 Tax=Achlya hypogyna TaxID=1202772 RepID=A0A1V9YDL9_ACHHY|nr:hypothetical protein ACHHYP_14276 [Achlya hypogyna]